MNTNTKINKNSFKTFGDETCGPTDITCYLFWEKDAGNCPMRNDM